MTRGAPEQLSLGFDDPFEKEIVTSRGATATETQCASKLVQFLLGRRGSHETYLHSLFQDIQPRHDQASDRADILTHHLLGFPADDSHASEQKSQATLGVIWRALVGILYEHAFPGQLETDWSEPLSRLTGDMIPLKGDRPTADFHFQDVALGVRYKIGGGDTVARHLRTTHFLNLMGFSPLMLCLRATPGNADLRRAGWTLLEADEALERIKSDTGIDAEAVVYLASEHPRVKEIRIAEKRGMYARLSDFCLGHYTRFGEEVAPSIHQAIAENPEALAEVLSLAIASGTLSLETCQQMLAQRDIRLGGEGSSGRVPPRKQAAA